MSRRELVRAVGRWDLTALVLTMSVGSGIFGLPTALAKLLGAASPLACVFAGAGIFVIVLCLAEVASRFQQAGGPYLYAREAFGRFVGLQVGWSYWLVRGAAAAANANLFVLYLAQFWGGATRPGVRLALLLLIFAFLALVNYRSVGLGAKVSDFLLIAKLLPLVVLIIVGLCVLRPENFTGVATGSGGAAWGHAILLMIFGYGGFEAAMIPAAEFRNPRRDTAFALLVAMCASIVLYTLVQVVVIGTVPLSAIGDRPLAAAASATMGVAGATLLAVGAIVSVFGQLSGTMLNTPRLTFALAERGDFPSFLAAVHPRFRTPHVSILLYAALSFALAASGSFVWNATLSAVARLTVYASTCLAVLVFRHRSAEAAPFSLRCARFLSLAGTAFCALLLFTMGWREMTALAITIVLAGITWFFARRRPAAEYAPRIAATAGEDADKH